MTSGSSLRAMRPTFVFAVIGILFTLIAPQVLAFESAASALEIAKARRRSYPEHFFWISAVEPVTPSCDRSFSADARA